MKYYILKRLFHSIFVLIGISIVVFVILHLTGDPAALLMPMEVGHHAISEHHLRRILRLMDWREQAAAFASTWESGKRYSPTYPSAIDLASLLQPPITPDQ